MLVKLVYGVSSYWKIAFRGKCDSFYATSENAESKWIKNTAVKIYFISGTLYEITYLEHLISYYTSEGSKEIVLM